MALVVAGPLIVVATLLNPSRETAGQLYPQGKVSPDGPVLDELSVSQSPMCAISTAVVTPCGVAKPGTTC